jgi:cell wall assembly regulator SMI1
MPDMTPTLLTDDLLDQLAARWRDQHAPITALLRPGLTDEEIDATTAPAGIRLPEEARRWWRWHDGALPDALSRGGAAHIGPNIEFLSLTQAVAERAETLELFRQLREAGDTRYWSESWLPIAPTRDPLVVDCGVGMNDPVPVRAFLLEDSDGGRGATESIGALVRLWIDAFDRGAWVYREAEGNWLYDWEKLRLTPSTAGLV